MTEILTSDHRMNELIQLAKTVAQSKATILIQGESGTGKELMASLIHTHSARSQKPFIAINCAAIPDGLLESELFGYEKGSFTGALACKPGKFELAQGGTLLLDEISELDARLQAKLLRVIQESEVDRIGGRKSVPVDVRIIATANKTLSQAVREGTFREDLFYRLNVVNLTIPPLKDRVGDISLLAQSFVRKFALREKKDILGINRDGLAVLENHTWPGNVRELENVLERAVITAKGPSISIQDICIEKIHIQSTRQSDLLHSQPDQNWVPGKTLDDIERRVIVEALKYHNGNRTHTAKALGISIRTLRNKISDYKRLGINL